MGLLDGLRRGDTAAAQTEAQTEARMWRNQAEFLEESIRDLEDQADVEGWRRARSKLDREFTRGGLDELVDISRAMYLSHPLIKRAVNVKTYYTWAQGVHYDADDLIMEQVVTPLIDDPLNQAQLYGHQARLLTDVDQQVDGNVMLALFTTDPGDIQVRTFPVEEIREIHHKPGDPGERWFYRRCWSETELDVERGGTVTRQYEVLYPDILNPALRNPRAQRSTIGGTEVRWDAPVIHQRTGGLKAMQFGVPETYAALDWARAYRDFLQDWHTIVSSLAKFAWKISSKGSGSRRRKLRDRIGATEGDDGEEAKRGGKVFMGAEGDEITPIPKTGATTSAEDAKPSRLMVASAADLPDTILSGDPQQGNLATAKTMDRPTELMFRSRQSMWADLDRATVSYAVWARLERHGKLPADIDPGVTVSFPSILEHDMETVVRAIVAAATLDGKAQAGTIPAEQLSRMLLQALNVEDVEEALADLEHVDINLLDDEQRAALAQATEALARLGGFTS